MKIQCQLCKNCRKIRGVHQAQTLNCPIGRKAELVIHHSKEESDSGREFSPTTIRSCRIADTMKLEKIFKGMKAIIKNHNENLTN